MSHGPRISPSELQEGDRVALYWSPYEWARRSDGHESPVEGTVTSIIGPDIRVEGDNGYTYIHYSDRGYIMGSAEGEPDVPDHTDIGRFRKYEELGPTWEERKQEVLGGGARYKGGGIAKTEDIAGEYFNL